MDGTSHRALAAAAWLATGHAAGLPGWQTIAGAGIAAAFSAGPTSPDIDNGRLWKRMDRWLPDEVLGHGGPLGHRRLAHWWGLPAVLAVVLLTVGAPWYAWAAVLGWASHIAGDAACGQAGYGTPKGVPLAPWWCHVGLGLKSGGIIERRVLVPLLALAAVAFAGVGPRIA